MALIGALVWLVGCAGMDPEAERHHKTVEEITPRHKLEGLLIPP